MEASYLRSMENGLLHQRIEESLELLSSCMLCPRQCGVDRMEDERGYCLTGRYSEVASYGPHFGEESVLVGPGGSGTIFFCGCNLLCRFCQNYEVSRREGGCHAVGPEELAAIMVELQKTGCHNINFVTPSHVLPQLLEALPFAIEAGLHLPLVYNCGGYERVESLKLLEGIVDIYMPDVKFWRSESADTYAHAPDYPARMRESLCEMQRQVGALQLGEKGLADRGLLVRHLLMPGGLSEAESIFEFIASEISTNCYLNIMDQYRPCGEASAIDGLGGVINQEYYSRAIQAAQAVGLTRLDKRELSGLLQRLFSP